MKPKMRKDLTGQRFGKLIAIDVEGEGTFSGKVYWNCLCEF